MVCLTRRPGRPRTINDDQAAAVISGCVRMSRRSSGLGVIRFLTFYLLSDILLNGPRVELSG